MDQRLELQSKLEGLLGSRNVYYQPPESVKMRYPAIKYSKTNIDTRYASDKVYKMKDCYELIVIDPKPDNSLIKILLEEFQYCSFVRHYIADNLNHDVLRLYY